MRTIAPALLLLVAACGQGGGGTNQASGPANGSRAQSQASVPTIAISATGPGGCAATWDGQAVTPAQITERSVAFLERAIAALGGAQNVTELNFPVPNVEAPADLGMSCADTILYALQRAGMVSLWLRSPGGQAPVIMDFPLEANVPPPPVPTVLGVGAGGQVTWNSDPIDAAGLEAQLIRIGGSLAQGDETEEPPPGFPELRVQPEATFGQLSDVLRTAHRFHLRPGVYLPSAGAGPSPVANSAPPLAAPAPPR